MKLSRNLFKEKFSHFQIPSPNHCKHIQQRDPAGSQALGALAQVPSLDAPAGADGLAGTCRQPSRVTAMAGLALSTWSNYVLCSPGSLSRRETEGCQPPSVVMGLHNCVSPTENLGLQKHCVQSNFYNQRRGKRTVLKDDRFSPSMVDKEFIGPTDKELSIIKEEIFPSKQ